jgi:hypothetical protein
MSTRLSLACAALLLVSFLPSHAQSLDDYREFYRLLRINATEQILPCYPATNPQSESRVIGVKRDSMGRVTEVTRFFFGNVDVSGDWSTMRIDYLKNDSTGIMLQRRRFYGPGGRPVGYRSATAEEVLFRNGRLLLRRLMDGDGNLLAHVNDITQSLFRDSSAMNGKVLQEWRYANGRQHYGTGSDGPLTWFAPIPEGAYYRNFSVDSHGELVREEVWSLERKRIPYPGGEMIRTYELNDCGQPVRVTYLSDEGKPMVDSAGVAYETMSYDDHGRLVDWKAFGAEGEPHGRGSDGVAAVRLTYRPFDGQLVREERFDAKGNALAIPPQQE